MPIFIGRGIGQAAIGPAMAPVDLILYGFMALFNINLVAVGLVGLSNMDLSPVSLVHFCDVGQTDVYDPCRFCGCV